MDSKAGLALFFSLILLFFTLVSSHNVNYSSQDNYPKDYSSKGVGEISNGSRNGGNSDSNSKNPATNYGLPAVTLPSGRATSYNQQGQGQGQGQGRSRCNPLNLGVCANLLNGLVNVEVGDVPTKPCCTLIQGLADLEAALCLCTAIRANVLGIIDLNLPVSLTLLLNNCGRKVSSDYQCGL